MKKIICPRCNFVFMDTPKKRGRPSKKECDKETIINFLKEGFEPTYLANEFKGWSMRQIAAIKAHVTMGTY